jgi:hypothetical protein
MPKNVMLYFGEYISGSWCSVSGQLSRTSLYSLRITEVTESFLKCRKALCLIVVVLGFIFYLGIRASWHYTERKC